MAHVSWTTGCRDGHVHPADAPPEQCYRPWIEITRPDDRRYVFRGHPGLDPRQTAIRFDLATLEDMNGAEIADGAVGDGIAKLQVSGWERMLVCPEGHWFPWPSSTAAIDVVDRPDNGSNRCRRCGKIATIAP